MVSCYCFSKAMRQRDSPFVSLVTERGAMGLIFGRKKCRKRAAYDPDEFVDTRPNPLLTRGFSKGSTSQGYGNEGGLYADNENWDDSPRDSWDDGWDR